MSKPKLTPETKAKILTAIRGQSFLTTAAAMAGVDRRSIYRWKEQGEKDLEEGKTRTVYAQFAQELQEAEAQAEFMLVSKVLNAGPKGALEILKRRFSERWGDRSKLEHSGPEGGPIETKGQFSVNLTLEGAGEEEPWQFDESLEPDDGEQP